MSINIYLEVEQNTQAFVDDLEKLGFPDLISKHGGGQIRYDLIRRVRVKVQPPSSPSPEASQEHLSADREPP